MNAKTYNNVKEFLAKNGEFLYQNEAANNLPIGIATRLAQSEDGYDDVFMCSIREKNKTLLVSIVTPPHDLLITGSGSDEPPLKLLARDLLNRNRNVPGILAENSIADAFCSIWKTFTGNEPRLLRNERTYQLRKCNVIPLSAGRLRTAQTVDLDLIAEWTTGFHLEIGERIDPDSARDKAEASIRNGEVFVWDDDGVVSMCASARESLNGKVINLVYTPPEKRGRGYATSCVHSLCQKILDEGKLFCSLFTDLGNPTSNSIYGKIGFVPIIDLKHYRFVDGSLQVRHRQQ